MKARPRKKRPTQRRRATQAVTIAPMPQPGALVKQYVGRRVPQTENHRSHYGKSLDLKRIDFAIQSANRGVMRAMTDIARETVALDGHLSSLLQKRLNRLAALDWDVQPATGENIDTDLAELYASYVRAKLENIPRFRDIIVDLDWGVFDGRAASEIEWVYYNGEWVVTDLHWIHPRRLSFGPWRDLRVLSSSQENGGFADVGFCLEQVPYKFVVYKPRLFCDYQEREGLAPRSLYWSFFQRFGTRERMALLELFGRPWRILEVDPAETSAINQAAVDNAYEHVKNLGYNNTAQLPKGLKLNVIQPFTGAGQVSGEAIDDARKVLSKLVLGNTGTTDAVSTGLGSSIGDAHLSEEDLIIASDARRLAETIEDQLTDAIIAVNFGVDELDHAPRFVFRTEPPLNREAEAGRIKTALELGMRVSVEDAQHKLGLKEVRDDQPYLQRVQREAILGQLAPAPANEIVYPIGEAPPPGEIVDTPFVGTNSGGGAPGPSMPPALPPGAPPTPPALPASELSADEDEPDAVAALAEKMTELQVSECEHKRKNRCEWCGVERSRDVEMVNGEAKWVIAWKPIRKRALPAA